MSRRKPAPRIVAERSRENAKRSLSVTLPAWEARKWLAKRVTYGAYSKHKFNPTAYNLHPYAGRDQDRTYCDAHAHFQKHDIARIPALLERAVMLGLWSQQYAHDVPALLWTLDESGWIFELQVTNSGQAQYHGYPVLPNDAFARQVLVRAREVAFGENEFHTTQDNGAQMAVKAAETFYR